MIAREALLGPVPVTRLMSMEVLLRSADSMRTDPRSLLDRAALQQGTEWLFSECLVGIEPPHFLPSSHLREALAIAAAWLDQPQLLSSVFEALTPERLGVLGFKMLTAPSLDASLTALVAGCSLLTTSGHWERRDSLHATTLVWRHERELSLGEAIITECQLAYLLDQLRDVSGVNVQPTLITVRHPRVWSHDVLTAIAETRVTYEGRESALTIPRALLEARPRLANHALHLHFHEQVEQRLKLVHGGRSVREALRRTLREGARLHEETLFEASARLGMSVRTLQRRLDEERTTFSAELEEARRERAFRLVSSTRRPLAEIASELGFSDASSFSRAFRRWFAEQPGTLRRRLLS